MIKLKRHADPQAEGTAYRTLDGQYQVEKDYSLEEWDVPTEFSWFVYTVDQVDKGRAGPPDALYEGRTLADCKVWLEEKMKGET
jgi:hypothetical protein